MDASKYITLNKRMKDITGQRFGRLVALGPVGKDRWGAYVWRFACDCGKHTEVPGSKVADGNTRSCGCLALTANGVSNTKEYKTWERVKIRCTNPDYARFYDYGGRGITMCSRWLNSFENFYADMGDAPSPKHSIDRIDNDGPYSPENCRWATTKEQGNNRRSNRIVEVDGERMTLTQAAERAGLTPLLVRQRIDILGWSLEDALNKPNQNDGSFTYNGQTKTLAAWSKYVGIKFGTLNNRINRYGWSLEKALTTPVKKRSMKHGE